MLSVMVGYSGTPLVQKLGIKPGAALLVVSAPKDFALDAPLAKLSTRGRGPFDVALVFVHARSEVHKRWTEIAPKMTEEGGLWFAWPKRASKIDTDVTEDVLRAVVLPTGWVDNKVCAIDERYSGLRFVLRLEHRR